MPKEKVSIIIPVYNCAQYLHECLDSVINQSYGNTEIIIIDDASSDKTADICAEYCKMDDRIFYYRNSTNCGSSASRNKGLEFATGDYISFVDGDDTIENDFLEILINNLLRYDADISICNFMINGKCERISDDEFIEKCNIFNAYVDGKITNRSMNKLYRKEVLKSVTYPEGRDYREDAVFTPLVLEKANKIICSSCPKYHYRMVANSMTHQKLSEKNMVARTKNEWECVFIVMRNFATFENQKFVKLIEKTIFNTFSCKKMY